MSKEGFKLFVKAKPNLAEYVRKHEMSWQEFYDMYELYGPKSSIWDKYNEVSAISLKNFVDIFKGMDMTEVQKSISSLQKGIGYLRNITSERESKNNQKEKYEPRKIYDHFDD